MNRYAKAENSLSAPRLSFMILCLAGFVALVPACGRRPNMERDGGTVLVYEVQGDAWKSSDEKQREAMTSAIQKRFSDFKKWGITASVGDTGEVRVAIPGSDRERVELVKRRLSRMGFLEFLIVAAPAYDEKLIAEARQSEDKEVRRDGKVVGRWVNIVRSPENQEPTVPITNFVLRDAVSKQPIEFSTDDLQELNKPRSQGKWLTDHGHTSIEALFVVNPRASLNVQGRHLSYALPANDEEARPCIDFTMTEEGANLLKLLTENNLPDSRTGATRGLAIILDDHILSAPQIRGTISNEGRITGNFTIAEVQQMVALLRAGPLPYRLSSEPVSETTVEGKK